MSLIANLIVDFFSFEKKMILMKNVLISFEECSFPTRIAERDFNIMVFCSTNIA